jgi:hypothetical protein
MEFGWLVPVLIVASISASYAFTSWIRARHGYPLENDDGTLVHKASVEDGRQLQLLSHENADLKGKILRLEERVAVLERIATDKGARLAEEIEALR